MIKTTIELELNSAKAAEAAQKTLKIEAGQQRRSVSKISRDGKKLRIVIEARDIAAAHATIGSFMRALKVFTAIAAHART